MILRVSPDEPCSEDKKLNKKKESSDYFRAFFLSWSWRYCCFDHNCFDPITYITVYQSCM